MSAKVYQAKKMLVEDNRDITSEALKNILTGNEESKRMVLGIFQNHNDQMAALIGKEYAPLTLRRFKACLSQTQSFI